MKTDTDTDAKLNTDEADLNQGDTSLKPRSWDEMVGQEKLKRQLKIIGTFARESNTRQDPILLVGPPGSGKSSLAALVAQEAKQPFLDIMITPDFKVSKLNKYFMELEKGFIILDEIQNMNKRSQSGLFSICQENQIRLDTGKIVPIEGQISIILATTNPENLAEALHSRLDVLRFAPYTDEDMAKIVKILANRVKLECSDAQAVALGRASAGTPRQARKLVKMGVRLGSLEPEHVLDMCGITPDGLTEDHIAYMESLYKLGGAAGIKNISNHSLRSESEIFTIEKLLVTREFIAVTSSGRQLMMPGMSALKQADII